MALNPPSIQNSSVRNKDFGNPIIQVILFAIVLVLFSWFLLKPKLSRSIEYRSKLKAAQAQMAGIEQDKADLNRLVAELQSSDSDVAKVDEALPLNGRVSKAYVLLDSLVRSSGMTLTLISADDTSKAISAADKSMLENPYQSGRELHTITLSTNISGTMEQFKNLLELLETNSRVLDIESVDVVGGEPLTKFRISVKAYSYERLDMPKTKK